MKNTAKNEKIYPSVKQAYGISLKSYDWVIQRFDAIEVRSDRLLAWISSVTLAIVTLVSTRGDESILLNSNYFYSAVWFFVWSLFFGLLPKFKSSLSLVSPEKLYNDFLHLSEWEFQKDMIYHAAEDFRKNADVVNRNGDYVILVIVFFLCEIIALNLWVI